MVERKHLLRFISVIGVALYASNLFVFLGEHRWRVYLKPVQDAIRYSNIIYDLNRSRDFRFQMIVNNNDNGTINSSVKAHDNGLVKANNKTEIAHAENVNGKSAVGNVGKVKNKTDTRVVDAAYGKTAKEGTEKNVLLGSNHPPKNATLSPSEVYLERLIHQQVLRRKSRLLKVIKTPIVHIGFLKVHKAFSTILQTMFFRFGFSRNLTFVLPVKGHYFSKSTSDLEKLKPAPKGRSFDILCNHGYFNLSLYASILPRDSVYIGIVREPFRQFISSYDYYAKKFNFKYLTNLPNDPVANLILYPEVYEESWPLSYTMNSMAKDFGFQENHYRDFKPGSITSSAHAYLESLDAIFDFVLVAEWLDESLVLMRRLLNWSMKDILYVKKNIHSRERHIDLELMEIFKDRNRLDYLLYDYFLGVFQKKMAQAGKSLIEETEHFKRTVIKVTTWCNDQYFGEFVVSESKWNTEFAITSKECFLMSKSEMDFINYLKKFQ